MTANSCAGNTNVTYDSKVFKAVHKSQMSSEKSAHFKTHVASSDADTPEKSPLKRRKVGSDAFNRVQNVARRIERRLARLKETVEELREYAEANRDCDSIVSEVLEKLVPCKDALQKVTLEGVCPGCHPHFQGNQLAHMVPGGCMCPDDACSSFSEGSDSDE